MTPGGKTCQVCGSKWAECEGSGGRARCRELGEGKGCEPAIAVARDASASERIDRMDVPTAG
jgi:hypothetical protein